ncbi:hypothetical protein ACFPRL_22910 [Pseudoclavibacter helvolus]
MHLRGRSLQRPSCRTPSSQRRRQPPVRWFVPHSRTALVSPHARASLSSREGAR